MFGNKMHGITLESAGGPEVLRWEKVARPKPSKKEVLIKQSAVGVNYIDIHHRRGEFGVSFPCSIGMEGAGVIEAVGEGCEFFKEVGMRVAYAGGPPGAYQQYRCINEDLLIRIPDSVHEQHAAALMVKGLTAGFLIKNTFRPDKLTNVLVHAAAGGVGILLTQWAKHLGATVIGTVGSPEKAEIAAQHGCDHVINYRSEDVAERVKALTDGVGVHVVYDGVGAATYESSLNSLSLFGLLVSYGEASGPIPNVDLGDLQKRGSLFITRPNYNDHLGQHAHYLVAASEMMELVSKGALKPYIGQNYYLSQAAQAHADIEARSTIGQTVLVVDT